MQRTGRLITFASMLLAVAIGAFATSKQGQRQYYGVPGELTRRYPAEDDQDKKDVDDIVGDAHAPQSRSRAVARASVK